MFKVKASKKYIIIEYFQKSFIKERINHLSLKERDQSSSYLSYRTNVKLVPSLTPHSPSVFPLSRNTEASRLPAYSRVSSYWSGGIPILSWILTFISSIFSVDFASYSSSLPVSVRTLIFPSQGSWGTSSVGFSQSSLSPVPF